MKVSYFFLALVSFSGQSHAEKASEIAKDAARVPNAAAEKCEDLDIGGTWQSLRTRRQFKILQNGCTSAKLQDAQRGVSYDLDTRIDQFTDAPDSLINSLRARGVPMEELAYRVNMIPMINGTTALEVEFEATLKNPNGNQPSAVVVTAKAHLKVHPAERAQYSVIDKMYRFVGYKKDHTMGSVTISDIRVKHFLRADGSIEPNKAYASGANVILRIVTSYFKELTVESFQRVK